MKNSEYSLSYITKNGKKLIKKEQKLFFCSHWDDLDKLLEIEKLVFQEHSCSIWYHKRIDNVEDDDIKDCLDSMSLFIIPITSRFLNNNNNVISKEIDYALKNNIPILPIMYEKGLEDIFAEVFGSIQFINFYEEDLSALDFKTKFNRFLNRVLIRDKTANQIREAFDAYIFLSYRKINRGYANELMQMIHSNDKLKSWAIWYDEYLIPGENFNEAISNALEKSSIFALVVTPDILQNPNYVKDVEYPYAKKLKKQIIPVEMIETDITELDEKYDGLDNIVSKQDKENLDKILTDTVRKLSLQNNKHNTQHQFFLGLAYLEGIDVEINYEYAYELIESAAECGFEEAIKKLFQMHSVGHGIERNLKVANEWGEILLGKLKDRITSEEDEPLWVNIFDTSYDLAKNYIELGKLEDGRKKYQLIIDMTDDRKNHYLMLHRLFTFEHLAILEKDDGNVVKAEKLMIEGEKVLNDLYMSNPDNLAYKRDEIKFCRLLGDIAFDQADYIKATNYFSKALKISEEIFLMDSSVDTYYAIVCSLRDMAWLNLEFDHLYEAERYALETIKTIESANEKIIIEEKDFLTEYAMGCRLLAIIYQKYNMIDTSFMYIKKAIKLYEESARNFICDQINSILVYFCYGEISLRKNVDDALKILLETLKKCEQLDKNYKTRKVNSLFIDNYLLLGDVYKTINNYKKAVYYYEKALSRAETVSSEILDDNVRSLNIYLALAQLYIRLGNKNQGLELLTKGEEYGFNLVYYEDAILGCYEIKKIRGEIKIHYMLAKFYELLAEYEDNAKKEKSLLYWARKSIKYAYEQHMKYRENSWGGDDLFFSLCLEYAVINYKYGSLCNDSKIVEESDIIFSNSLKLLSHSHQFLEDKAITSMHYAKYIYDTSNEVDKALDLWKTAFECAVKLYENRIPGNETILLEATDTLIEHLLLEKKFDETINVFQLFIQFKLEKRCLEVESQKIISRIYNNMSYYYEQKHEFEYAKKCCEKVIKYRKAIMNVDNIECKNDLACAYSNYAWMLLISKEIELSKLYLDKAINLQREVINKDNNDKYRKNFVRTCNRFLLFCKENKKLEEAEELIAEVTDYEGIWYDSERQMLFAGISIIGKSI